MGHKPTRKTKLTDAERFKRFHDMAREVEASDDPKDFDKAFDKAVHPKPKEAPARPYGKRASS
jgi:hypothetical protein